MQKRERLQRVNCDYREVLKKETLQHNAGVSTHYEKFWNLNIFEYSQKGNAQDLEFGISKNEYKISATVNKVRTLEHLVKYGDI
jgi:hypothetical protein